jgi:hypothetical protein
MSTALEQFIAARKQEENLRGKKFPLKCLLKLYLKVQYRIPFNDFKLLVSWLSPIESPEDNGAKFFLAFNSFETQQIAALVGTSNFVVQQTFMEIYNDQID